MFEIDIELKTIIPAVGWRLVSAYFNDDGDFACNETPLISWALTKKNDVVSLVFAPHTRIQMVVTYPGESFYDCPYGCFRLLRPGQELTPALIKELEAESIAGCGYPHWSKEYRRRVEQGDPVYVAKDRRLDYLVETTEP